MTHEEIMTTLFDYYHEQSQYYPQMEYAYGFLDAMMMFDKLVKAEGKK